jgi:hypothetical protein
MWSHFPGRQRRQLGSPAPPPLRSPAWGPATPASRSEASCRAVVKVADEGRHRQCGDYGAAAAVVWIQAPLRNRDWIGILLQLLCSFLSQKSILRYVGLELQFDSDLTLSSLASLTPASSQNPYEGSKKIQPDPIGRRLDPPTFDADNKQYHWQEGDGRRHAPRCCCLQLKRACSFGCLPSHAMHESRGSPPFTTDAPCRRWLLKQSPWTLDWDSASSFLLLDRCGSRSRELWLGWGMRRDREIDDWENWREVIGAVATCMCRRCCHVGVFGMYYCFLSMIHLFDSLKVLAKFLINFLNNEFGGSHACK